MEASQIPSSASPDNCSTNPHSVFIKCLPEDDEPLDSGKVTPGQQIVGSRPSASGMALSSSRVSCDPVPTPTEPQPQEKRKIEDLMSMIQQMQTSHDQQISELREQYTAVSTQLEQLKSLLSAHCTSQLGSLHLLQSNIASISTRGPASQSAVIPPPISTNGSNATLRPVLATAPPRVPSWHKGVPSTPIPHHTPAALTTQRQPSSGPSALTSRSHSLGSNTPSQSSSNKTEMTITPSSLPNEPPTVEPSHLDTVAEAWEEFRYGRAGNMSVEKLDALWGPRWRQDPRLRIWYQRRKAIADRIKLYMADGISEQDAVMELDKMRRSRTLNWVSRILLDDRKETKKQRKVAAQAAVAARKALHGMPTA